MGQKNRPSREPGRMSPDELSQRLRDLQSSSGSSMGKLRETELQAVLHELEVYQIELEMQNRELQESRQALEDSHERYVNLYDFAPIGYMTLDERGTIKELNLTLAGMLGVERRWIIDRSFSPWILPSDLPVFRNHMKKCQSSETRTVSTLQVTRKDKQVIIIELLSICSIDPSGNEKTIKTAVLDITKKKELEQDLNLSLVNLKQERKLRELFVSTLTHDLRTPLAATMLSSQLILQNSKPEDQNHFLATRIYENTARMDVMIQDLLDANRIRAGDKISLTREESDLVVLVQKTLEVLTSIHGNRFKLVAPKSCRYFFDRRGLQRVLENLCNNAIKYGDPDTLVTITIEQFVDKISLSIHNEGPVISRRDQTTLFNQFQRTQSAEAGGKKGWGIGLTLIRGLVEGHGGTVHVESELGKGTNFIIEFPL